MKRLLFVDDEEFFRNMIPMALKGMFDVQTAADADEASGLLDSSIFDVVMTDYDLKDTHDGVWILEQVKRKFPDALRILFSGSDTDEFRQHVKSGLIHRFVPKVSTVKEIIALVSG